ncbi:MAG: SIMPL domain-containing protein, partial [Acidobacteriota bacterium]|nr:SIMPL domain-containing protein [Acidobacteriota bacterium]
HGLRFEVKNREALEREALQLAVANAMGRAEALAAGAKRTIDRVIRIEESSVGRGPEMPVMAMRMKAEDASTPVAAGELEIRAQVRIIAALK